MTTDPLSLFARQLSQWAQQIIDNGRSPFRKVETFPSVLTDAGVVRPPLVFWINRQSLMAGGLLFLPPQRAEDSLDEAVRCAEALGVRHFVTWAPSEIVFWVTSASGDAQRWKDVALSSADELDIDRFRDELVLVMNELKLLSVTGAIPPQELSPCYLANLCLGFLQGSQAPLAEAFRVAKGQGQLPEENIEPEVWACRRAALSLFRLLGLVHRDLLPESIQPERLEQAMALHLAELPLGLSLTATHSPAPTLPAKVAVRLHYLFRRIGQISWLDQSSRASQTLRLLMDRLGPLLGGGVLPANTQAPEDIASTLLINPRTAALRSRRIEVAASPALQAALALERDMLQLPQLTETAPSPLELSAGPESFDLITGALLDAERPVYSRIDAALRRSWPTRRFGLSKRTPLWCIELLHLLGLTAPGGRLNLVIPEAWLSADLTDPLFGLLQEQFRLKTVHCSTNQRHQIDIVRRPSPETPLTVSGPFGERSLPEGLCDRELRARILLALHLPDDIHALVESERLSIPTEDEWNGLSVSGALLYANSTLGRAIWQSVGGSRLQSGDPHFVKKAIACACPMPGAEILGQLQRLDPSNVQPDEVDRELTFWLETELSTKSFRRSPARSPSRRRLAPRPDEEQIAQSVSAKVFVDGIPRFPQHYLFDHYRPELRTYSFTGPLKIVSTFFITAELQDRTGQRIEVEGSETAEALVLASYANPTGVALPTDRKLTEDILARYRRDLMRLRHDLLQEAHARISDATFAARLVERVWQDQQLPPMENVGEDGRQ